MILIKAVVMMMMMMIMIMVMMMVMMIIIINKKQKTFPYHLTQHFWSTKLYSSPRILNTHTNFSIT